ncbi:SGNH/GDSL hydrolase family protein [Actinoplanes sp. NPDC051851]|uniref:SGNH/GDSL hydrolase family protein n=1 Tax=Actinoplanes sp. NPDC051851 TaxID=3154753 RepID=UPI00341E8C9C
MLTSHLPSVMAAVLLAAPPLPAHTAGRTEPGPGVVRFSWPGVYFEGRFRGTSIGIVLNDASADYDVQIDGAVVATLVTPGSTTYRIRDLAPGNHEVRLVKRSESPWAISEFGGFRGDLLPAPAPRHRQIEFIGDSYTAGYGDLSPTRDCTSDEVNRTTDADVSFGALTARRFGADYQINAFSGRGMVRNYNGGEPGTDYRTYYDRALLSVDGDVWHDPSWRPQVVVVGLGINDFSTPLNPGEKWTTSAELEADYVAAYNGFLDRLRARYGPHTEIVVSATYVYNSTQLTDLTRAIVASRTDRVHWWYYDSEGLDYAGCHWHPSAHDHELIADRLTAYLTDLHPSW